MTTSRLASSLLLAALAALPSAGAAADSFVDVLDAPSQTSPLSGKSLLEAVTHADGRLIAVGQR